jgi:hypothetical protein
MECQEKKLKNKYIFKVSNEAKRDDKEPGPSWGKQLPGERPRETAET